MLFVVEIQVYLSQYRGVGGEKNRLSTAQALLRIKGDEGRYGQVLLPLDVFSDFCTQGRGLLDLSAAEVRTMKTDRVSVFIVL